LSNDFKSKESELGRLLKTLFELPLLPPDQIEDCFLEDLMSRKPTHEQLDDFFDYLLETYILADSDFPPIMCADFSSNTERTFQSKLNAQFYSSHPNIFPDRDIEGCSSSNLY